MLILMIEFFVLAAGLYLLQDEATLKERKVNGAHIKPFYCPTGLTADPPPLDPKILPSRIHQPWIPQSRIHQPRILPSRIPQSRIHQLRILPSWIPQSRILPSRIHLHPKIVLHQTSVESDP